MTEIPIPTDLSAFIKITITEVRSTIARTDYSPKYDRWHYHSRMYNTTFVCFAGAWIAHHYQQASLPQVKTQAISPDCEFGQVICKAVKTERLDTVTLCRVLEKLRKGLYASATRLFYGLDKLPEKDITYMEETMIQSIFNAFLNKYDFNLFLSHMHTVALQLQQRGY